METYFLDDRTLIEIPRDVGLLTAYARDKLYNLLGMEQYDFEHQLLYRKALERFGDTIKIPLQKNRFPAIAETPFPVDYPSVPIANFRIKKVYYDGRSMYTLEFIKIEK